MAVFLSASSADPGYDENDNAYDEGYKENPCPHACFEYPFNQLTAG
jgi:hypothetical protein